MPPDPPELGNLALDFLHTRRRARGGAIDLVRTPDALVAWLVTHAGEPTASRLMGPLEPPIGRLLLEEARRLRGDIGTLVETYAASGSLHPVASYGINRLLEAGPRSLRLVTEAGSPALVETLHARGHLGPLVVIAEAAAHLVSTVEPGRVRACASAACGAWFADTSKGGRRRWCSMARCGNRQKASAHRARGRTG
ncbi:MAG: CGNR zinc finger domain-containing protein [Gemmatimonadales bacterium]